jgi:hypothetical protein
VSINFDACSRRTSRQGRTKLGGSGRQGSESQFWIRAKNAKTKKSVPPPKFYFIFEKKKRKKEEEMNKTRFSIFFS